jgi:PIN domain nuclease of toxin-antitoxin system
MWLTALVPDDGAAAISATLSEAERAGFGIFLSPITAWELANSASKGRVSMPMPIEPWLERAVRIGRLRWTTLSVGILLQSTALPDPMHPDPADRIIVATARELGMKVVTRDRKILAYAGLGHVMAIPC